MAKSKPVTDVVEKIIKLHCLHNYWDHHGRFAPCIPEGAVVEVEESFASMMMLARPDAFEIIDETASPANPAGIADTSTTAMTSTTGEK